MCYIFMEQIQYRDITDYYKFLILDTLRNTIDAEAKNDLVAFCNYVKNLSLLLEMYMTKDIKEKIANALMQLKERIQNIKQQYQTEQVRKEKILEAKYEIYSEEIFPLIIYTLTRSPLLKKDVVGVLLVDGTIDGLEKIKAVIKRTAKAEEIIKDLLKVEGEENE